MIWILLALLGVPLWLVVGGFLGALWNRRLVRRTSDGFACKMRSLSADDGSGKWGRATANAHWVHDVLLVNDGIALARTNALPVRDIQGGTRHTSAWSQAAWRRAGFDPSEPGRRLCRGGRCFGFVGPAAIRPLPRVRGQARRGRVSLSRDAGVADTADQRDSIGWSTSRSLRRARAKRHEMIAMNSWTFAPWRCLISSNATRWMVSVSTRSTNSLVNHPTTCLRFLESRDVSCDVASTKPLTPQFLGHATAEQLRFALS